MDRIKNFWCCLLLVCFFTTQTLASTSSPLVDMDGSIISDEDLRNRIENLSPEMNFKYTSEIKEIIRSIVKYKQGTGVIMGRSSIYFPIIEETLMRNEMPDELKYLSVVESGLNPNAKSKAGAVGMWQFMKGTAKMYDLKIDGAVDERRDPRKSSEAASVYLYDLYKRFGDWTLALAAYNCGPGNVAKAARRAGSYDFWELKRYLPKETRRYIPKFIAYTYVFTYHSTYDIYPSEVDKHFHQLAVAKVYDGLSFKKLSNQTGISSSILRALNPSFISGYIPKSQVGHYLVLPEEGMIRYMNSTGYHHNLVSGSARIMKSSPILPAPIIKKERILLETLNEIPTIDVLTVNIVNDQNQGQPSSTLELKTEVITLERFVYQKLRKRESLYDVVKKNEQVSFAQVYDLNSTYLNYTPQTGKNVIIRKR